MHAKTLLTVEEFDKLEEPDELRYELDAGELIVMTRPRPLHNRVVARISYLLQHYLVQNPIGEVFTSDNLFVLGPNTKRAPDVAFLRKERAKAIDPTTDIPGAPDLAVEVLSPNDSALAMRRKVRQYFAAGASLVWVLYPESREVEVWEDSKQAKTVLHASETLDGGALLPGFAVSVAELFP
jgi:Uma2 family endonuclease